MKRLPAIAAITLAVTLSGHAWAQQDAPPAAGSQHMHAFDAPTQLQRLTKQLQLTPDQQAKIGPLLEQRGQQLQAIRGDASVKPADRRAKTIAIVQDSDSQISGVLTQEQRDKWKAVREKAMERMQEKRGQNVPAAPGSSGG